MSLKTIPGSGKSATSRTSALQVDGGHWPASLRTFAREEELGQLLRGLGERLQVLDPGPAPFRVPRAERRRDDRLEQRRLAVGRGAERAQVARRDPEARERVAGDRDVDVRLRVDALSRARRAARAARTPRARARGAASMPARSQSSSRSSALLRLAERGPPAAPLLPGARRRAPRGSRAAAGTRRAAGAGSSRARSTSSSPKSR